MKIVSVVGARPQFIKAAVVSKQLRKDHNEILVHTGQHYDMEMSGLFFKELSIPRPDYNLGVGSKSHAEQTGEMMKRLEKVLMKEKPVCVIIYGDTNSTLAGALAAAKLNIPIAHVEAGMRSFDMTMPEEINRIVADRLSSILFCSTKTAVSNLKNEGIRKGVYNVGDVMIDALIDNVKVAKRKSKILKTLRLRKKSYYLLTIHRSFNTDNKKNLKNILDAVSVLDLPVIFPVHPRTRKVLNSNKFKYDKSALMIIKPVGYLDMIILEKNAKKIITDSGGMQKEAYFFKVPCITLRDTTEWVETVEDGWNILVGTDKKKIVRLVKEFNPHSTQKNGYGNGKASKNIRRILKDVK